jgi:hypothetical protein
VQYHINIVKNLKISSYEGENANKVVSLLREVHRRLKEVTTLPDEFPKRVLKLLQTTTVAEFNSSFSHLQRNVEVVKPMISGRLKPSYPSIDSMLKTAEKLYLELASTNQWTGLRTKANESGFVAHQNGPRKTFCWNCGQEHQ